ncbi:hypothetical protein TL16_g10267 [Triparma laevis f. inornata]|uniref:Uncharacterized protein n=1 Tax=Triparma laevis f. inornata TaxID=1714386 RepID=A0A9W7BF32_9STRA|nr:hypothetical protein TL16_g10267 [Triparma laevis f. inornata]
MYSHVMMATHPPTISKTSKTSFHLKYGSSFPLKNFRKYSFKPSPLMSCLRFLYDVGHGHSPLVPRLSQ